MGKSPVLIIWWSIKLFIVYHSVYKIDKEQNRTEQERVLLYIYVCIYTIIYVLHTDVYVEI